MEPTSKGKAGEEGGEGKREGRGRGRKKRGKSGKGTEGKGPGSQIFWPRTAPACS